MSLEINQPLKLLVGLTAVNQAIAAKPLPFDRRKTNVVRELSPQAIINGLSVPASSRELRKFVANAMRKNLSIGVQRIGLVLAEQNDVVRDSCEVDRHRYLLLDRGIVA